MRAPFRLAPALLAALPALVPAALVPATLVPTAAAHAAPAPLAPARPVHEYLALALSPDGKTLASIEGDPTPSGAVTIRSIVLRPTAGGPAQTVALPCGAVPECTPSSLTWSPDGKSLAFVLRSPGTHNHAILATDAMASPPHQLLSFNGTLVDLRYLPNGKLAVLATPDANKEVGAVQAGAAQVGVLGTDVHEQRIAVLDNGGLTFASPPNLFVYEYAALPDGGFVGTAAPGDGDNNWWVAKLMRFEPPGNATVLYAPTSPSQQIGDPQVSPDGKTVAFIAGIMSDFGPMGGDAFRLDLASGQVTNLTEGAHSTVRALSFSCAGTSLILTELAQQNAVIADLPLAGGQPATLYSTDQRLGAGWAGPAYVRACGAGITATVHQSFSTPPEIAVGLVGKWHDLTTINHGITFPVEAKSLTWTSDQYAVQGWLLLPHTATPPRPNLLQRYLPRFFPPPHPHLIPMITMVHGGPAWANMPAFIGPGLTRKFLDAGYAVLLPNPRGSYGQGEAFTRANIQDFGYGDLRDILHGVDAAEHAAPIDDKRLGLTGWSYGGYMTMWAVTQTNRFAAAVAGAGISNWQSYYGENGISAWMIPYFGASVYQNPAVYAKSSPITFITHVHTPTLEVVGERDIECPAPQTLEFWHALTDLGIPTQGVIYPGEGHGMHKPEHIEDFENRSLAWFQRWFANRT